MSDVVFCQRNSVLMQFTLSMFIQCAVPFQGQQQQETSEIIFEGGNPILLITAISSIHWSSSLAAHRTLHRYAWQRQSYEVLK
jgi:hypothetical protein